MLSGSAERGLYGGAGVLPLCRHRLRAARIPVARHFAGHGGRACGRDRRAGSGAADLGGHGDPVSGHLCRDHRAEPAGAGAVCIP